MKHARVALSPALALAALHAAFLHPADVDRADPSVCFALDDADIARIADIANKAATSQIERLKLDDKFKGFSDQLTSAIDGLKAALPTPADDKGKGKGKGDVDVEAMIRAATEKQAAEFKSSLKAETDKREAAEKSSRDTKFRAEIEAAVEARGIKDPIRKADAVARLISSGKVKAADDGRAVYVKALAAGLSDELVLADGLKEWIMSDEGKSYVPPKGAGGSGSNINRNPSPNPSGGQGGEKLVNTSRGPMTQEERQETARNARRVLGDALIQMGGGTPSTPNNEA